MNSENGTKGFSIGGGIRYAVMSDIHANAVALSKSVDEARAYGAEAFVCLGDFVGYGPDPNGALALSREVFGDQAILGNNDAALLYEISSNSESPRIRFDAENIDWLKSRPPLIRRGSALFLHGDVRREAAVLKAGFGYVFRPEDVERVFSAVDGMGINIVFVGHTHEPMVWRLKEDGKAELFEEARICAGPTDRYVINVGTVGRPRGVACASYAIVDELPDGNFEVELRMLEFDYA